jgi:hypothetical protein
MFQIIVFINSNTGNSVEQRFCAWDTLKELNRSLGSNFENMEHNILTLHNMNVQLITLILVVCKSLFWVDSEYKHRHRGWWSHKPTLGKQANKRFWEELIDNFPSIWHDDASKNSSLPRKRFCEFLRSNLSAIHRHKGCPLIRQEPTRPTVLLV